MKNIKAILPLFILLITFAARATVLFQDSVNYPYNNGPIEGQGQWYGEYPLPPHNDVMVTNNVIILNATNDDSIGAPTNGWVPANNGNTYTYASFQINVSDLPPSTSYATNGSYFFEYINTNYYNSTNATSICRVFVDQIGTVIPGTYRLGIANVATEFAGLGALNPPVNFPMDLATNTWYTVVVLYDNTYDQNQGAFLWVNPSLNDYNNFQNQDYLAPGIGEGFVFGTDPVNGAQQQNIAISQLEFSPYSYDGNVNISNVMAATLFTDVLATNLPIFALQPVGGTSYSGNPATFQSLADGIDLTYQWYSQNYGALTDGVTYTYGDTFTGSTSNILTANNLSASDTYWCVAKDAYGNTVTSSNVVETVNTTQTPPFFNLTPIDGTNNLFTIVTYNNPAQGTGPLYYQWYFASNLIGSIITYTNVMPNPTNMALLVTNYTYSTNYYLSTFIPLQGQTSSSLSLDLLDYSSQGAYYVSASNTVSGGSIAIGPTNALWESSPLVGTIQLLHSLEISFETEPNSAFAASPAGTYVLSSNLTVSGYVTSQTLTNGNGLGNAYSEWYIQDTNGFGSQVFIFGFGNSNTPPLGTNITVTGTAELYNGELEMSLTTLGSITTNAVPPITISPLLANSIFGQLATNMLGTNSLGQYQALLTGDRLLTFTNVYLYSDQSGHSVTNIDGDGIFYTNGATFIYMTVGQYNTNSLVGPINTNSMEIYQFGYNYPYKGTVGVTNGFFGKTIPPHCYQLTAVYVPYISGGVGAPEVEPALFSDYVINPPPVPTNTIALSNKGVPTVNWLPSPGSTYSVYGSTNLLGPWTQAATGLAYYPTNGAFTDTSKGKLKFYYITSP